MHSHNYYAFSYHIPEILKAFDEIDEARFKSRRAEADQAIRERLNKVSFLVFSVLHF